MTFPLQAFMTATAMTLFFTALGYAVGHFNCRRLVNRKLRLAGVQVDEKNNTINLLQSRLSARATLYSENKQAMNKNLEVIRQAFRNIQNSS